MDFEDPSWRLKVGQKCKISDSFMKLRFRAFLDEENHKKVWSDGAHLHQSSSQ